MKTLSLILFLFIGTTLHAQYDSNGMPIAADDLSINNEAPYYEDTQTGFQDCIWEDVRPLDEINTSSADSYPWISPDGLRLYFTQRQISGRDLLMMTSRASFDSLFGNPQLIPIIDIDDLTSCWLTNDELEIFITRQIGGQSTLFHAQRDDVNSSFSAPVTVQLNGVNLGFFSGPSLTQDKSQLFLFSDFDGMQSVYVFDEIALNNYSFSHAMSFGNVFTGQLTKNSLGYYVTSGTRDLYSSYRNSVDSVFNSFTSLVGMANSSMVETQPTLSENEEIMVFVRAQDDV